MVRRPFPVRTRPRRTERRKSFPAAEFRRSVGSRSGRRGPEPPEACRAPSDGTRAQFACRSGWRGSALGVIGRARSARRPPAIRRPDRGEFGFDNHDGNCKREVAGRRGSCCCVRDGKATAALISRLTGTAAGRDARPPVGAIGPARMTLDVRSPRAAVRPGRRPSDRPGGMPPAG